MNDKDNLLADTLATVTIENPENIKIIETFLQNYSLEEREFIQRTIFSKSGTLSIADPSSATQSTPDTWKFQNLRDAYKPQPPMQYAIDGLFAMPSLNVVYGHPGDLKSMLMTHACVCIAAGKTWLPSLPTANIKNMGFKTKQGPCVWMDFDNGKRRTDERFGAFGRFYSLDEDTPVFYSSMAEPSLNLSERGLVKKLITQLQKIGAVVLGLDNLCTVSGVKDENSSEIGKSMANLRWLAEESGVAIIVIHHERKSNGYSTRRGDSLRGHSSIEASLDLALQVQRPENSSSIVIRATKVRGADVKPFGAMFSYEHNPGTSDLDKATFWGVDPDSIVSVDNSSKPQGNKSEEAIMDSIAKTVADNPNINLKDLVAKLHEKQPGFGQKKLTERINQAASNGTIKKEKGPHNSMLFSLSGQIIS